MASVITSRRPAPKYLPSPADIEAATAELDAKRLAAFDSLPTEEERLEAGRIRSRRNRAAAKEAFSVEVDVEDVVNAMLHQSDESEPLDLDDFRDPRQTEQWLPVPPVEDEPSDALNFTTTSHSTVCGKVPVPEGGPVEMTAADRCGFDLRSFFELNAGLDQVAREERWTLGDVDPETVDLSPDALADYRASIAKPLPPLKTEMKPKPFKVKHEARPFRSSKK